MGRIILWVRENPVNAISLGIGVAAVLIAVFFGLAALADRNTAITYKVINESDVLDVRTSLEDLEITFQGQDIQENNLNLRVFAIRVENTGETVVLQTHYDQNVRWGLEVSSGKVIEARSTGGSSDYLESAAPIVINESIVEFPKVILEKGTFFTFDMLVLHEKSTNPEIIPLGKIAGINEITVSQSDVEEPSPGFFDDLFPGGWLVQFARVLIIGAGSILALILFAVVLAAIVLLTLSVYVYPRRRRRLEQATVFVELEDQTHKEFLRSLYVNSGRDGLVELKNMLDSPDAISSRSQARHAELGHHSFEYFVDNGIISLFRNRRTVNPEFVQALEQLIRGLSDSN